MYDRAGALRAMRPTPAFWLAMLAASALGTNLGDLWTARSGIPEGIAFGSLVIASAVAIAFDRIMGDRHELAYWVAIVVLRASATNVGDFLIEQLHLGFGPVIAVLLVLTLAAGTRTSPGPNREGGASPIIDVWYWTAMLLAGVFGTVAGDCVNATVGVLASAAFLSVLLLIVLLARAQWWPALMVSYWIAVLAERAAGTPLGDGLASRRGVGLGLNAATAVTATLFALALLWRGTRRQADPIIPS